MTTPADAPYMSDRLKQDGPAPRRPRWRRALAALLSLESGPLRAWAFLMLLGAAFLSPNIALRPDVPAIRLEQLLLPFLVVALLRYHIRHPAARRVDIVDLAFLLLTVAIAVSIVVAPLILPSVGRSYRDVFQLARPVEYWLFYRLARTVPTDPPMARRVVAGFCLMAIAGAAFGLLQVTGSESFNDAVTSIWTGPGHNLAGVIEDGRAVGTAGNANNFGLLSGWCAVVIYLALWRQPPSGSPSRVLPAIALAFGAAAVVLSQSRSASLSILGAAVFGTVALIVTGQRTSVWKPAAMAAAGVACAVAVIIASPHGSGAIAQRFNFATLGGDASVVERLAILRYPFAKRDPTAIHGLICGGPRPGSIQAGHEPETGQGVPPSSAPALDSAGADAAAKGLVTHAAALIEEAFCATDRWPDSSSVALPSTAEVVLRLDVNGYLISTPIHDTSDPDWPAFTLTSQPNLVLQPSLETVGDGNWRVTNGSHLTLSSPGRFGTHDGQADLAAAGGIEQWVIYTLPQSTPYTGSAWFRSADGQPHRARLQLDAWLVGGDRIRSIGHATAVLPADGQWLQLSTSFETPATGQIYAIHVAMLNDDPQAPASFDVDGVALTAGGVPASFAYVRDANPATLPSQLPSYWDSPLVGLGPLSNVEFGAIDNEYALMLLRFGIPGLVADAFLFLSVLVTAFVAWRRQPDATAGGVAFALGLATLATVVYNVAVGTFYQYQLMAIFWLWAGWVAATARSRRGPTTPSTPGGGDREPERRDMVSPRHGG